ncbi:MAG: hypothetical protein GPJ52_00965 [Candidatus Heimdallarchaeota archaeon]|nr:hypothetical protein [Candidatus Heimdallarchaeota archaeon]
MEKGKQREVNKKLIIKALVDPKFREELEKNPTNALGVKKLTERQIKELQYIKSIVISINELISSSADMLLCADIG